MTRPSPALTSRNCIAAQRIQRAEGVANRQEIY